MNTVDICNWGVFQKQKNKNSFVGETTDHLEGASNTGFNSFPVSLFNNQAQ